MRHSYERKKIKIWILMILLTMIFLKVGGTFAAYVSRSFVKGVATTPKQGLELSSNYLAVVSEKAVEDTYPAKKIILAEKSEDDNTPYIFTFSIMNTADGSLSTKRMSYSLKMSNLPEGTVVTHNNADITTNVITGYSAPPMNAYTRETHTYTVSIPKENIASAADIIVTAKPDADSDTSGFILAGRIQPSIVGSVVAFSWNGTLLDTGKIEDYAAFNYQISVSNASGDQMMCLSWNNKLIEIDPLFLKKIGKEESGNSGSLTFTMNDSASNYLIQFYRLTEEISDWSKLNIKFEPAS